MLVDGPFEFRVHTRDPLNELANRFPVDLSRDESVMGEDRSGDESGRENESENGAGSGRRLEPLPQSVMGCEDGSPLTGELRSSGHESETVVRLNRSDDESKTFRLDEKSGCDCVRFPFGFRLAGLRDTFATGTGRGFRPMFPVPPGTPAFSAP